MVCSRTGRMQRRRERMMLDFHPILTFFVPSSHSGWIILRSMMPVMNWSGIQGMLFIRSTYQRACERKRALLRILCLFHNYIAARRYKRQQPKVLRSSICILQRYHLGRQILFSKIKLIFHFNALANKRTELSLYCGTVTVLSISWLID